MRGKNSTLIIHDHRLSSESNERSVRFMSEEVAGGVGRNHVAGVVQRARPILNLPKTIRHIRLRVGGPVEDFCIIHGQAAGSLRERSFHTDDTADATDLGVDYGKESVQPIAVELDPLVPHIVRHGGVLASKNLELIVLVNDFTIGGNDEGAIEEFPGELGMLD